VNAVFVGRRRSGKTTRAFRKALDDGGGIVVFDPKREFRGWPFTVSSVAGIEAAAKKKAVVIVYHPNADTDEEFSAVGEWVLNKHRLAMQTGWLGKGLHFTLLYDEAHNSQGPNWINNTLLQILSQNRPEILNVYQTFQSAKDIQNRLKSRISDWYIFSTTLPADLEYLNKEIGLTPEMVSEVANLGDYEYLHFCFDGGVASAERVNDSAAWYTSLVFTKEDKKEMADREKDDNREDRDEFPKDGITILDRQGLDEAHRKYNRRQKDDPSSKYRQRASDNQRDNKGGNRSGGGGKTLTFGRKSA